MKNLLLIILFALIFNFVYAQTITTLSSLPEPISNNAVTSATVNGIPYIYTFGGIDATKVWSGIHARCYRMNTQTQIWEQIPDLPSGPGRIGAAASTIKNKIYIIGGYAVAQSGNETTLPNVHIYDPESNTYLADGAFPDVRIDDQVQAVYRDSLIYVVSGWSTNQNVNNIQVYDPASNSWSQATPLPSNLNEDVFGGSGTIVGDTLYFLGGATDQGNFGPVSRVRKLWINPNNPTELDFAFLTSSTGRGYRMGATTLSNRAIWIGGAQQTYNFDGIAYNGSGGVTPNRSIRILNPALSNEIMVSYDLIPPTMDLRGVAKINESAVIIVGGMTENQEVTDRVYQIDFDFTTSTSNLGLIDLNIYPNPTSDFLYFKYDQPLDFKIFDSTGKKVASYYNRRDLIPVGQFPGGMYTLQAFENKQLVSAQKILISETD